MEIISRKICMSNITLASKVALKND
jgi:hypothetical protein